MTHILQVIPELLQLVVAGDVWGDDLHLVHVSHEGHGRVPPHATPPAEEEGSPRGREDTVDAGNVVQDLVEEEDIQLMMLTPWEEERSGEGGGGEGGSGRGEGDRRSE